MTRPLLLSLICAVLFAFLAAPAVAETRRLASTVSESQLKAACDKAGGDFVGSSGGGDGYFCAKSNCDGKGGTCLVDCNAAGSCTGTTPMQLTSSQTLLSILQNGDLVSRHYDPVTTAGTGGGDSSSTTDPGGGGGGLPCEPLC
jgi:hypothetical protein